MNPATNLGYFKPTSNDALPTTSELFLVSGLGGWTTSASIQPPLTPHGKGAMLRIVQLVGTVSMRASDSPPTDSVL